MPQPKRHTAATQETFLSRAGTGTQNNLAAMPRASPQEPAPYLATHLLCSRCQLQAGKAPNPLLPPPQPASRPRQPHTYGQGHPSSPRAAKASSPLAVCPPSPSFPSHQPAGKHDLFEGSLSSSFPRNLLCDLAEAGGQRVEPGKPTGQEQQPLTRPAHGTPCRLRCKEQRSLPVTRPPPHQLRLQPCWFPPATFFPSH